MLTILAFTESETTGFVCVGVAFLAMAALVLWRIFHWLDMIHDKLSHILGELRRSQPPEPLEPLPDDPQQPDTVSPNIIAKTSRAKIDAMFKKFRRK